MGDEVTYIPDLPDKDWPHITGSSSHLGGATDGWRSLSWRCGDHFAFWVIARIAERENRFALLRACVVTAQASGFGARPRDAVAALLGLPPPPEARAPFGAEA